MFPFPFPFPLPKLLEAATSMDATSVGGAVIRMAASTFNHRDYVNAWNTHSADKAAELYAESAVLEAPELPEPIRGKDAIRKNMQTWLTAFPEVNADAELVAQTDKTVALLIHYTGAQSGPLALAGGKSIPATNKSVRMPVAIFLTLDANGKIAKERDVYDMASLVTQLGISPEQAGIGAKAGARAPPR